MTCRFEIKIKGTNRFMCCVHDGSKGWAYTWSHNDKIIGRFADPCPDCRLKIDGEPSEHDGELKDEEFQKYAGQRIRPEDWNEFQKRGIMPGSVADRR